jgi:hypothetical protein
MKTARFSMVVAKAGKPEVHTSWVAPEKDAVLKKALANQRVMTVHVTEGQADFGTVGFQKIGNSQVLLFPKSLRRFADRRVVGIKYDLLADNPPSGKKIRSARQSPARPKASSLRPKKGKTKFGTSDVIPFENAPPDRPGRVKKAETRGPSRLTKKKEPKPRAPAPPPPQAPALTLAETMKSVRRAIRLLKDGQAVPAYEILVALEKQDQHQHQD